MPVGVNGVAEVVDASAAVNVIIMIDICCCDDGNWREYRNEVNKELIRSVHFVMTTEVLTKMMHDSVKSIIRCDHW
jgi:hypothetical protein